MNIEASCPWCHDGLKNDVHVLFLCNFTKTVRIITGLNELSQLSLNDTTLGVIASVFARCTKKLYVQFVMLYWGIWNRRNKRV